METNPFTNKLPPQEKPDLKVRIATEKDLGVIKELRLFSIQGKDAALLGVGPRGFKKELKQNAKNWVKNYLGNDKFALLLWNNSEAVGMGTAQKVGRKVWYISSAYVKPEFRGRDAGLEILRTGLGEILDRGGERVEFGIMDKNKKMSKFAALVGSTLVYQTFGGSLMELDLTDQEVIKKLKRVLNAG